jgi:hypothetical protein
MSEELHDENGKFKKGNPGKQLGTVSKATRFKNLIYDAIEKRSGELTAKDVLELAKLAAKFVPKEMSVKGEFEHKGFIENMIKKAKDLKDEQEGTPQEDYGEEE